MLVGKVAARLAAAVLEVCEAAAVEEGGRLAAPGTLEGLHEAMVEAVVARAHSARLAHHSRLRGGPREARGLPSDCTRPPDRRAPTPPRGLPSRDPGSGCWESGLRVSSARSPPPSAWCLAALLALLPLTPEWLVLSWRVISPVPLVPLSWSALFVLS